MAETPLSAELAAVRGELPRVDGKCGTLAGLTMAGVAFLATQVGHGPVPVRVLMGAAGVVLAAATLVLLLAVIRPRMGSTGFRLYAQKTPATVGEAVADHAAAGGLHERELVAVSVIVNRKYLALRAATDLTAVAVALTALAILVAAIVSGG